MNFLKCEPIRQLSSQINAGLSQFPESVLLSDPFCSVETKKNKQRVNNHVEVLLIMVDFVLGITN